MNCKNEFSREHLHTMLPKTWLSNEYKKHREKILFEREKALLPATQNAVQRELIIRSDAEKRRMLVIQRKELFQKLEQIKFDIRQIDYGINRDADNGTQELNFTYKCPSEECRGFLNNKCVCGICEKHFCKDCNLELSDEHECDPDLVATHTIIKKECKPCPSCSTLIFKIDGCDQMWCTECMKAFSWKSGRIETKIHNPHYYEYLRENKIIIPREPGDEDPCDNRLPNWHRISMCLDSIKGCGNEYDLLINAYRSSIHVTSVELPKYHDCELQNENEDVRIKYLLNEISENGMQLLLQKREKLYAKKTDIRSCLTLFTDVVCQVFKNMLHEFNEKGKKMKPASMFAYITELHGLSNHINHQLDNINKLYNSKSNVGRLDHQLNFNI
jgi:hypothetical protein